jgi:TonB family protein
MAYVELGQDNGGILLNLSEGGFAVQSALTLTSHEFPELRFQVPAFQGWLGASGRIVWMSESKKEAGIQFTELPGEARREIHKWVLAEGDLEEVGQRMAVPSKGQGPSTEILDTPYRGGRGPHEPAIAHGEQAQGAQAERARLPPVQEETAGVAVTEQPRQDFRFPEYSMFAADPEKEPVWAEPVRRRGNWGGVALLGILLAALFFGLGATVGRGTVDQWISYLGSWTQNQPPAPRVTPPVPPEQAGMAGAGEDKKEAKSGEDQGQSKTEDAANPSSGMAGDSGIGKVPSDEKKDAEAGAAKTEAARGSSVDGGSATSSPIAPGANERRPRHATENAAERNDREMEAAPGRVSTEHSILVNAPEPGSPPFVVNLPGEAVSASAAVAISARRTLEILPRSSAASGRSERVVIGKLISHSEPFYPAEARNRRIEGIVELRARVGRTGEILGVTPVSGPGLLMSAAATAVREWRYEPTFVNGDPAETVAYITTVFRLP